MEQVKRAVRALLYDHHGKLVIAQRPNIPIGIWATCWLLNLAISHPDISTLLRIIGTVSLIVWAILEIGWGVNYFRRLLGAAVLAWTIVAILG